MSEPLQIDGWWLGIISYILAHLTHIIIWRVKPVQRDVLVLLWVLLVIPFVAWLLLLPWQPQISFAAVITHLALAANYIAIYPAFQATSPTIEMLYRMGSSPTGVSAEELVEGLGGQGLVSQRIEDLERAKLIARHNGRLVLQAKGRSLANLFYCYRKLIGLPAGAG